ncbi:MAG TPA: Fic family protein [Phycisphaerales bacterium]|nr:Fic family protein [Phycisphaerales bacterium]
MAFHPRYTLSPSMTRALMSIEADRQAVLGLPIDVEMLASLRATARLLSTHYSTQIEGNRLTQAQVAEAIKGARFPGRARDEAEVKNYYAAMEWVEKKAAASRRVSEDDARALHGLVMEGRAKGSPYRDGQNVIRDSGTGAIVYLPPEAKAVPALMGDLFAWVGREIISADLPVPVVAGMAHYQYATIHPYYDGNGRTARLLTTLVLHQHGYGLKGIYALEEYYARDLGSYYGALAIGTSHNYHAGRAEADVSPFLDYFLRGMADAFARVRVRATEAAGRGAGDRSAQIRRLDPKQREAVKLFRRQPTVAVAALAEQLGLSPRTVRPLVQRWVREGFLVVADPSRKNRLYRIAPAWEALITS